MSDAQKSDSKIADDDEVLLGKINRATAALIVEEMAVQKAQAELVSKSKEVGLLLLEAKKRHPKVANFEAFLKRVNGLKLSRAYDLLRLAGGRTTDEELRQETRDRVRKHREKKKLPKPEPRPEPKPVSVTNPDATEKPKRITESAEVNIEQRKRENAALDVEADLSIPPFLDRTNDETAQSEAQETQSHRALCEFRVACNELLPLLNDADWVEATSFFDDCVQKYLKAEAA